MLSTLYRHSLAMLTDLYQLTMAYGYWRCGIAERESVFHLSFRSHPFHGGFAVACGQQYIWGILNDFHFSNDDLEYLAGLHGADAKPLFSKNFLDYLGGMEFRCDVDAIPEGTVVFAREPLVRVRGPLLQCQLIETALLNSVNFQTLIATKAARICKAAEGQPVLEFGLRRAQGVDGGLAASRASYIGGCAATSNVLAGKLFGIPVKGTHAHSWVMAFPDERTAFEQYAGAMPNNCIFLVDTYDTKSGVENALAVAKELRRQGHEMLGIRLDSGDLVMLSRQVREALDSAGFTKSFIVASNDLDEYEISRLKQQGAEITVWGVGTRLATAYDQPALGGVYKLSALRDEVGHWRYTLKLSEQKVKVSDPGILQVRRYGGVDGRFVGDVVFDMPTGPPMTPSFVPLDAESPRPLPDTAEWEDLLIPMFRDGRPVCEPLSATKARQRAMQQLSRLPEGVATLDQPAQYCVGLEHRLARIKAELTAVAARESPGTTFRDPCG